MLAMDKAIALLATTFMFGYYDSDDIRQEAYIFGLEALPRYDPSRPLENFLYTHIRNRLINFKRDKYHRTDPPCRICAEYGKHADGSICQKFISWKKRNSSKQNLMRPQNIQNADDTEKSMRMNQSVLDDVNIAECLELIDNNLDVEFRATYIRMKNGEPVPKSKRFKIEELIKEIISGRKKAE